MQKILLSGKWTLKNPKTNAEIVRSYSDSDPFSAYIFKTLARLQITKEDVYERAAKNMGKDKVLIVCDRGLLDNKGYLQQKEFKELKKHLNQFRMNLKKH